MITLTSDAPFQLAEPLLLYQGATFKKTFYYEQQIPLTITAISTTGNPTTITTSQKHCLEVGDWVNIREIEGCCNAPFGSFQVASVPTATTFTIAYAFTETGATGGKVGIPVNLLGAEFAGEIRDQKLFAGLPGVIASVIAGTREVLLQGQHDFDVGDKISVTGAGLNDAEVLAVKWESKSDNRFQNWPASVLVVDIPATSSVAGQKIVRAFKTLATFTTSYTAYNGEFNIELTAAQTEAIAPPNRKTDEIFAYDVKLKMGTTIYRILQGEVKISPRVTQSLVA